MDEIKNDQVEIKDEDIQEPDFTPEELENDTTDWKAKALELKGIAKRKATQLKKLKEAQRAAEKIAFNSTEKPQDKEKKSGEIDYAQKAFLLANGVKGSDEIELVKTIMADTGKSLDSVLESRYFQSELKDMRDARATKEATPGTSPRSTVSVRNQEDYWLQKGELPPRNEVELRRKVVNARMKQEKQRSQFTDNPIVSV